MTHAVGFKSTLDQSALILKFLPSGAALAVSPLGLETLTSTMGLQASQ